MELPENFLKSLQNVSGFNKDDFIALHISGEQVTSIRLNPSKNFKFKLQNVEFDRVPWSSEGFYLGERPSFTLDPLFHAGVYYVQEASSMFLEQAIIQNIDLTQPLRILDLCAAPGGKSTLIQSLISDESLLVSNEIIKTRVNVLAENLTKWGAANVVVTNNQPKDFEKLPGFFDVLVVDAPCSGSGLFRKDLDAIDHWSLDSVAMCARRQKDILSDALPALKPGGILIYSTCSYSTAENEEISDWLIDKNYTSLPIRLQDEWGVVETKSANSGASGYRFYPDKLKGEGFFIASFKKTSDTKVDEKPFKNKLQIASQKEVAIVSKYTISQKLHYIKWQDHILAMPSGVFNALSHLQSTLYVKKAGVNIGSVIRDELIPHHELAMSILLADIHSHEVDQSTALDFLRRKDISIQSTQRGWILLRHRNIPLGWIKNLGNRINNYYPKEWRILNK